jgi:hypothetical protein
MHVRLDSRIWHWQKMKRIAEEHIKKMRMPRALCALFEIALEKLGATECFAPHQDFGVDGGATGKNRLDKKE